MYGFILQIPSGEIAEKEKPCCFWNSHPFKSFQWG